MLHELPITNVRLLACHEDWHQMTPTERGRHCQSCKREVIDFTAGSTADLARAYAAAPDGRVCGHLRRSQLAGGRPVRFGLWARAFALAVALVLGQGLTARQAWAQVCGQRTPFKAVAGRPKLYKLPGSWPMRPDFRLPPVARVFETRNVIVGMMVPQPMPQFPGGHEAMLRFLRSTIEYPATTAEGKVFVNFTIDGTGAIHDARVMRGVHPLLDAEALRAVRLMPRWQMDFRGRQPYSVSYTIPISFTIPDDSPAQKSAH